MITRVRQVGDHKGVFVTGRVAPGEAVLPLRGVAVDTPYRFSLQIAPDLHLAPLAEFDDDSMWCFVNHACDPNCHVDLEQMALVAIRDIPAGAEVTFNYCSTEEHIVSPFGCDCGADGCYRQIRGFRHLSTEQRQRLPFPAPHLLALAAVDV